MSSRCLPRTCCTKIIDGKKCEPMERLVVDVPTEYVGAVIEKSGRAQGRSCSRWSPIGSR